MFTFFTLLSSLFKEAFVATFLTLDFLLSCLVAGFLTSFLAVFCTFNFLGATKKIKTAKASTRTIIFTNNSVFTS